MGSLNLKDDEVVILRDADVYDGQGNSVSLILTNERIIQTNRNFWGKNKDSFEFNLLDLKAQNGKPNILIGKDTNGKARLELYFVDYPRYYTFSSFLGERKWSSAIEKAYKAAVAELKKANKEKLDIGSLISPLKETLATARGAITPKVKQPIKKTLKCPHCGAELNGTKGEEVACAYCGNVTIVK